MAEREAGSQLTKTRRPLRYTPQGFIILLFFIPPGKTWLLFMTAFVPYRIPSPALPTMARPTFNTKPVPDRTLVLSGDEAVETFRITSLGQTGLVRNDAVATTYRLRATGDLVTVAPLPQSEALPYSAPLVIDPPLRVRGRAAEATFTVNGTTAVRWIENDTVFEMSSRTLSVAQLAELANRLR